MTGRHRRYRTLAGDVEQLRQALVELARLARWFAGDDSAPDTRGTALRRHRHRRA